MRINELEVSKKQLLPIVFLSATLAWTGCTTLVRPKTSSDNKNEHSLRSSHTKPLKLIRHPEIDLYIYQVAQRLLSAMKEQSSAYRFFLVEDSFVNAFANPTGNIYLNTGLIERLNSTDEVAAVLAHEIAHVKLKHAAGLTETDPLLELALLVPPPVGLSLLPFALGRHYEKTRQLERQADTQAIKYMVAAGYDPTRALQVFNMLDGIDRMNPTNTAPYLRTHPSPSERVDVTAAAIRLIKHAQATPKPFDPIKRAKVILRLEKESWSTVIVDLNKLVSRNPQSAEALQLLGIAYLYTMRWAEARESLERARALNPEPPGIHRDLGRLYSLIGELSLANESFDRCLKAEDKDALTYVYLGELLEKKGQVYDAALSYRTAHDLSPRWDRPVYRMAYAYSKMNRMGNAHYYLGRYYLLRDENAKALIAMHRALKIVGENSPQGKVIQDEIKAIKQSGA